MSCARDAAQQAKSSFAIGEKAPGFSLKDIEGKEVRLADFSGKTVVLEFWATWCPPCKSSVADLIRVQDKYKAGNVVVLAISVDEGQDIASKLTAFAKENNINYRILIGTEDISRAFNVRSIPTVIVIDSSGVARSSHTGYADDFISLLSSEIDKLL